MIEFRDPREKGESENEDFGNLRRGEKTLLKNSSQGRNWTSTEYADENQKESAPDEQWGLRWGKAENAPMTEDQIGSKRAKSVREACME